MAGLRGKPHSERAQTSRAYPAAVALLTASTFVLALTWGLLLPWFDGPDEAWHHNSVARLIDGGGWPQAYDAAVLESTWQAVREGGGEDPDGGRENPVPAPKDFSSLLAERSVSSDIPDYMVQHPPAYYASVALVVGVAGGGDLRWDHAQALMRAVSAAWVAAAVPFLVGTVRWSTASRSAALVGGAVPLGIPFFTNAGAYVSNDTLLVASCSATLYLLVRGWRDPDAPSWLPSAAGLAYGVALLTKGFALFLGPAFLVLLLLGAKSKRPGVLLRFLLPSVVATAVGGWWWVRNYLVLGTVQPSRLGSRERVEDPVGGYSLGGFLRGALGRLNDTFWGRGGRPEVALPDVVTLALLAATVVLLLLALTHRRARTVLLVLALYPLAIATITIRNAHGIYYDTGRPFQGVQGRYLYSGVAVLAVAAGACAHLVLVRLRGRARGLAAAVGVVLPLAAGAAALWWTVDRTWTARADGPGSAGGPHLPVVALVALVAALAVLVGLAAVCATRLGEAPMIDAASDGPKG